ncbi:MAG TPA: HlyD family efflux transporter periplasmic adaptor subunit [Firmicutes bacterium]|nr:HlyD family efflux transporter periplasmic adaptor subunit [Bacillota bacterium]
MQRKLWLGALLVIAIVSFSVFLGSRDMGKPATVVDTGTVKRGAFSVTVSCSGVVEPKRYSEVRSALSGRIEKVLVQEGEVVSQRQLLATFDVRDLTIQLKEAEAALAGAMADLAELSADTGLDDPEVRQARARLDAAKARYKEVSSGPSEAQVAQAKASLEEASIALAEAEKALSTSKALYEQGAIAKNELENAVFKEKAARARYESARLQYEEMLRGPRATQLEVALSEVKEAEIGLSIALEAAKNRAGRRIATGMRLNQAKSSLAAIQAKIRASEVRASTSGIVTDLSCTGGQAVPEGALLMKIADVRNVIVRAKVDEVDIIRVSPGQPAIIMSDAVAGTEFKGRVSRVAPEAVQENSVPKFQVDVDVMDPRGLLRPGMSADVEITVYSRDNAVLVPSQAIVERNGDGWSGVEGNGAGAPALTNKGGHIRKVVLVVSDGKVREVPVETGAESAIEVEVTRGLAGGEMVVTGDYQALRTLRDGDPVRPRQKAGSGRGLEGGVRVEVGPANGGSRRD